MSGQYAKEPYILPEDELEHSISVSASSVTDVNLPGLEVKTLRPKWMPLSSLLSIMSSKRRNSNRVYEYHAAPTEEFAEASQKYELPQRRLKNKSRMLLLLRRTACYLPLGILTFFGILHLLLVVLGRKSLFWNVEDYEQYLPNWSQPGHAGKGSTNYPTDVTRDILPIPCHSHNDYWRKVPLFDAIHAGCISVEADVWMFREREELYVGHDTASLTPGRTLASLYVNPLVGLLDKMNPDTEFGKTRGHGVFDEDPSQTLVLLIDFKTNGPALFPRVRQQLEPLRNKGYLSYWDGQTFHSRAVTAVGTGNTPFDLIEQSKEYRDIFFDAPLDEMWEDPDEQNDQSLTSKSHVKGRGQGKTGTANTSANDFNSSNSYYASTSLKTHIGFPWTGRLSPEQLNLIRGQIKGAKRRGLKARYWDTPSWPTSLRNHLWQLLVEEGADILNVDDLKAASKLDWTAVRHGWIDA